MLYIDNIEHVVTFYKLDGQHPHLKNPKSLRDSRDNWFQVINYYWLLGHARALPIILVFRMKYCFSRWKSHKRCYRYTFNHLSWTKSLIFSFIFLFAYGHYSYFYKECFNVFHLHRSTQNDEMCNFYMMYYTEEADKTMSSTYCFSSGPPSYYWASDPKMASSINNIPKTASVIPDTDKVIKVSNV